MIVLDASVVVEILLRSRRGSQALDRLRRVGVALHAPELLDVEVAQVMRRYAGRNDITSAEGVFALQLLSQLPVTRHSHRPLMERVWLLRENLTAYDGVYVALAEALGATLLTCDTRLSKAAGHRAEVELA